VTSASLCACDNAANVPLPALNSDMESMQVIFLHKPSGTLIVTDCACCCYCLMCCSGVGHPAGQLWPCVM
jgi:hypothetical protein